MIIEKTMHDGWLSNTYLVADKEGGHAVIIDTGGPMAPITKKIEELKLTVTHVLCTHHHWDHVEHNDDYKQRYGCPVCGHPAEKPLFAKGLDKEIQEGDELVSGELRIRPIHIPGHTIGQLGFIVNDERVFTGDTLFKGSIGGTRGPGHTTFEDIKHSIMEVLMKLPKDMVVHPGHVDSTTIGQEWESNPFVRQWRGADSPANQRCLAFGEPATLLLNADDYDGGKKAWVRFDEGQKLDIAPGSKIELVN